MNERPHTHYCPKCDRDVPCTAAASGGCIFPSSSPITCEPCVVALVAAQDARAAAERFRAGLGHGLVLRRDQPPTI